MHKTPTRSLAARLRQAAGAAIVDNTLAAAFHFPRALPIADPARYGVETVRDIVYGDPANPQHRLDVWKPTADHTPRPVIFYVHGGGFRILSKDSHWVMALSYARRGYVVFNIDYRLAPTHKFPAAIEDVAAAYRWVVRNAARFGGDPTHIAVAGESAGANLATSLVVATCYARSEPWARETFDLAAVPTLAFPSCGVYQVTDIDRIRRRKHNLPTWLFDRLHEVEEAYLHGVPATLADLEMADPLRVFESGRAPDRPLPVFQLLAGTHDPLLDDTRRLATALRQLGARVIERVGPGEMHGFDAMVWRRAARECWAERYALIEELMGLE